MASGRLLLPAYALVCCGCRPHSKIPQARDCSSQVETFLEVAQEAEPSSYKWRLHVSYDGSKYAGWQLQQKPTTVQLMLEEALTRITKLSREKLVLVGASRTDSGVHALGQVAHFHTPFQMKELETLHASLNGVLPWDIRVKEVAAVRHEFHARHSAKRKIYHYKAYSGPFMDPFQLGYTLHVRERLNIDVMREAAKFLIGEHDFTAFASASRQVIKGGFVREIYKLEIIERDRNFLFEVEGSGFFYKQVRNMVGLLLEIGKELLPPSAAQAFLASRCRELLGYHAPSAPPQGLYLVRVMYDKADLEPPLGSPHNSCGIFQTHTKCKIFFPHVVH